MKSIVLTALIAVIFAGALLFSGVLNHAYASAPIELTFICCDEEADYEDISFEICPCFTGLELKEELASAINDGGIAPNDLFLLYETTESDVEGQIYDTDCIGDYLKDGDTVYYVISPVPNGETYEDKGFFECIAYDQYSGLYYYTFTFAPKPAE